MKKIMLLSLFAVFFTAKSQDKLEEYKASNGITYKVGDNVLLGKGSGIQGTFVYLRIAGWAMGSNMQIGSAYAGLNVDIKKIKTGKFKGVEKVYFTVGGGNITNYSLDIEAAIESCEVKDCKSQDIVVISESDKYDKLKKLKILLDEGTLTKEEYESEKKKLLN
jgi:hypothetical protein